MLMSARAWRACFSYAGSLQYVWDELPNIKNIKQLEKLFISTFPNVDVFNNKFGPINLIDSAPEWPARLGPARNVNRISSIHCIFNSW